MYLHKIGGLGFGVFSCYLFLLSTSLYIFFDLSRRYGFLYTDFDCAIERKNKFHYFALICLVYVPSCLFV